MNEAVAKWRKAISLAALEARSKTVVKLDGKQILVLLSDGVVYACNNRCPHEGFPLSEGTLSDGCVLTCNWHSWRFDLDSGETLAGGDALRLYPHEIRDGEVWLDISDPGPEALRARALSGLREAFDTHDYERIARELVRFQRAGGEADAALTEAFAWAVDGLETGTSHAHAAAPDWLRLRADLPADRPTERLIPVVEIIGHLSWDVLTQDGPFPIAGDAAERFDAELFERAIEAENEAAAIAQARAGLREGGGSLLRPSLERASLRHYQAFGHSVIYQDKAYELLGILGERAEAALLLPLVRSLCTTAREDLIPEFKAYAPALAQWDDTGRDTPDPDRFRDQGVQASLDLVRAASGQADALYHALMFAAWDAMLHFDGRVRETSDRPVQENVDWLDFTHAITHLNAARKVCLRQPALWPNALLQTGCFLGRNAKFVDWQQDVTRWKPQEDDALIDTVLASMLDHGEPLYIFPAHTLKLATALKEELALSPDAPWKPVALAALNRFVHEPMKRKHMRRVAKQATRFVELE